MDNFENLFRPSVRGIVVDAGHGGDDPGAIGNGLQEKDLALQAANYMYKRFQDLGIPVAATRTTDRTLTRDERVRTMVNSFGNGSDVLVLSNHINAGGGEGAEIVYPLRSNSTLARSILEEIGKEGQVMRKYYQRRLPEDTSKDYYYIQRLTPNTQSLLIEYGFIDNANDVRRLQANLLNYAEAVVRAVANYANVPYSLPSGSQSQVYTVQKGDSLYSIANKFGTSVNELITLNQLSSNVLQVGQTLKIPTVITENETPSSGYTVQKGDSLYSIANKFGTSVNELKALNNLTTNTLQIGQLLNIPTGDSNDTNNTVPMGTYIVQRGDSLYSIANKFNTTVDAIISLNNLSSNILQIGQTLKIPSMTNMQSQSTYTVQKGDSLYSIANKFGTTVNELMALNNLTTPLLYIGQVISLPTSDGDSSISGVQSYTVQRGDSLYSIADRFNTTVNAIITLNNLSSTILQIGQVLQIPNS